MSPAGAVELERRQGLCVGRESRIETGEDLR